MPFKSVKQERKFYVLEKQGKISPSVVKEWQSHTDQSSLPMRSPKRKKIDNEATESKKDNEKTEKKK